MVSGYHVSPETATARRFGGRSHMPIKRWEAGLPAQPAAP